MRGTSSLKRAWSVRGHFTPIFTIFNRQWSSKNTGFQRAGKLKSEYPAAALPRLQFVLAINRAHG